MPTPATPFLLLMLVSLYGCACTVWRVVRQEFSSRRRGRSASGASQCDERGGSVGVGAGGAAR